MKSVQKRELIRVIDKENIHFHGPQHRRPGEHVQVFDTVKKLGGYRFDQYLHNFTYETHQKPWRAKIKQQVERVVVLAEDCRYARQNEFGWRLKLEPEILARFSTEVTCKRCSSKLWRSEVEVLLNPADKFGDLLDLEQRQANRKPCSCSEVDRILDRNDPGICRIFHDRMDEPVKYSEADPVFKKLPSEQKPDRVYGFRKTSRFRRLLDGEVSGTQFQGQELRDILECSPFNELRDQVLFPFLVLEAKSETGDSFDDIEIQTAFAIKKLLDIQLKLKVATGVKSQWQSGPLVWFLSSRGDDWRIAAAYVEMEGKKAHYHIYHLWAGSILSKDAALQILLIMDYIFDWARDSQREAILDELRIFAGRNTASIADDSEICSRVDPMQRFLDTDLEQYLPESRSDLWASDLQQKCGYHWLDSKNCVFRGIRWVHARFSALYITKENLNVMLRSFTSEAAAERHARELLRLFREAWKVTPDALEALEFMWTGNHREDPDLYGATQRLCAVFTVAAYFTPDWEQVSELTYIAIAENALDDLKAYVDLQQPIHVYLSQLPQVQQDRLVGYFRHFRQCSARSRLHATMRRSCLSSRLARENDFPDDFFLIAEEPFDMGIRYRLDVTMLPDQNQKSRKLIAAVYNQCKKGMRDPDETFLRVSGTHDSTSWDNDDMPSVWNLDDLPLHNGALCMLIGCDKVVRDGDVKFCIFVMDDKPAPQAFPLSFDLLELYYLVQTNHHEKFSASQSAWNTTFRTEPLSSDSTLLQQLWTPSQDLIVHPMNELVSDAGTEKEKRSTYQGTKELPPQMRSNLKTPEGHWVAIANPSNTLEDFRWATDFLVARKQNAKQITCLYAQNGVAGRAGLGFEERQDTANRARHDRQKMIDELNEKYKLGWAPAALDFQIKQIVQRGDIFRLSCPSPKRDESWRVRKRRKRRRGQGADKGFWGLAHR